MRADVQNLFIGIHMLYIAHERDLTLSDTLPELESLGYRVAEREVETGAGAAHPGKLPDCPWRCIQHHRYGIGRV